jgi:hypothetical protein
MRSVALTAVAAVAALGAPFGALAAPEPADVTLHCIQRGAAIPPGPPNMEGGVVIVTPSPQSGASYATVIHFVPGPCSAPGFAPNR